ncbi:hypothetical protein MRX96_027126 [Rhipicephalus microplus]
MLFFGLLLLLPLAQCSKTPPDIIFLLADDLGWDDVSFHGSSQIPTPNLDALAADGVILNNYYAQPACTPSRSALMTGLYPARIGMGGLAIDVAEAWALPSNLRILPHRCFLMLSYQAVHGADIEGLPQAPQKNVDKFPYIGEQKRTIFAGMVDAMDQSVGEVFAALNSAGMLQNAVIAFSSDNGGAPFGAHASRSFNWPLRGAKGTIWEGGHQIGGIRLESLASQEAKSVPSTYAHHGLAADTLLNWW